MFFRAREWGASVCSFRARPATTSYCMDICRAVSVRRDTEQEFGEVRVKGGLHRRSRASVQRVVRGGRCLGASVKMFYSRVKEVGKWNINLRSICFSRYKGSATSTGSSPCRAVNICICMPLPMSEKHFASSWR